jgi:hypothetical protein
MEDTGGRRLPMYSYYLAMFGAAIIDLLGLLFKVLGMELPFLGNLFIIFTSVNFMLAGYSGGIRTRVWRMFFVHFLELFLSFVPGCMLYVWLFKRANHSATSELAE